MKYIQSAGGYYYKQYKNGKKVRISKRAYNKKIGGMQKQQQQNQQQSNQQQSSQQQSSQQQSSQQQSYQQQSYQQQSSQQQSSQQQSNQQQSNQQQSYQQQSSQQQSYQQQNLPCKYKKPKFKKDDRVQCNSDICFQKFGKYLMEKGDYINFKPLNLKIIQSYCRKSRKSRNAFDNNKIWNEKKENWRKLLEEKRGKKLTNNEKVSSKSWIIYEVASNEDEKTIVNIEEKSLSKKVSEITKNTLTMNYFIKKDEKDENMNDFAIFAHGSECFQKSDSVEEEDIEQLKWEIRQIYIEIKNKCKSSIFEIIKHITSAIDFDRNNIIMKVAKKGFDKFKRLIKGNEWRDRILNDIIDYQISLIFGWSEIFQDNFELNLKFHTIEGLKLERRRRIKKENIEKKYYNVKDLTDIYTDSDEYKEEYDKFLPIFIKNNDISDLMEEIISSSPRRRKYNKDINIEYLSLHKLLENIRESDVWFKKGRYNEFLHYFTKFMTHMTDKNIDKAEKGKYKTMFGIYQDSLNIYSVLIQNRRNVLQKFCPTNIDLKTLKKQLKLSEKLFKKFMDDKMVQLKEILSSYSRKRYNKVLRDIILYDNQSVIMKCDAGCSLYEDEKDEIEALIKSDKYPWEVDSVKNFLNRRMKLQKKNFDFKDYCIFQGMVPNILLQCAENLTDYEKHALKNYNNYGVFKLPLQFEEEDTPRKKINENYRSKNFEAPWELNIYGLKDKTDDGDFLHYLTNIKQHKKYYLNGKKIIKNPNTTLEKIIKKIRTDYGDHTPFTIFLSACRSGECISVEELKKDGMLDGGLKKKVKKGGLKKKVKTKKAKVTAKKVRKSKKN